MQGDLEFPIVGDEGGHSDADVATMGEFIGFFRSDQETVVTAEAARNAVATAVAGLQSILDGGKPVRVAPLR